MIITDSKAHVLRPAGRETRGATRTEDSHVSGKIIVNLEIEASDVLRVTTGITPSGVFFPLRMFRGWPLIGTRFDAANLDRLDIDGPLLFETLQAFGAMALWVSTVNDIGLSVFRHKELSLAELV